MKYKYYVHNCDNPIVVWRVSEDGSIMCFGHCHDTCFSSILTAKNLADFDDDNEPYARRITAAEVKALFPHAYAK